ncbi:hypothetical protein [Nostoc punctiforme]|uniref:hypothetical protein n=1 Tax=Nostoc punctiforme TaxID=272131 RepID=UPI0002F4F33A|nr:hypothetical protein [Nostoc punctiforme]
MIGDRQFHCGYSLILLKKHIRELYELPPPIQSALFQEVMLAGQAIVNALIRELLKQCRI